MTKEELAAILNGRETGHEIKDWEELAAKAAGLVVIFTVSYDCIKLRGATYDETYHNSEFYITAKGVLLPPIGHIEREVLEKYGFAAKAQELQDKAIHIQAYWSDPDSDFDWSFRTTAPHATFEILEEGYKYCHGIVIDLKDAKNNS